MNQQHIQKRSKSGQHEILEDCSIKNNGRKVTSKKGSESAGWLS